MPVKIRLMRIGTKSRPFYRVVAVDERKKRTGAYLELLGTYNPLTEPKEIILKEDRITYWMEHGAVPSHGYLRIIGKAPQKPPRKPKKAQEKKAGAPKAESKPAVEETGETSVETPGESATPAPTEETTDQAAPAEEQTGEQTASAAESEQEAPAVDTAQAEEATPSGESEKEAA